MMSAAGAEVSGVDFSKEMLALAATAAKDATLKEGDAGDLPFDDDEFDAVVCNFGMMHLPDQPQALTEIHRVLRLAGQFVMATWVGPQSSPAFGAVFGAIKAHADFASAPPQPDLFAFANPSTATQIMGEAGLSVTSYEVLTPALRLSAPEELFEIFLTATVGASMLIKSQKPEVIEAIRQQITATVTDKYADGSGISRASACRCHCRRSICLEFIALMGTFDQLAAGRRRLVWVHRPGACHWASAAPGFAPGRLERWPGARLRRGRPPWSG